MLHFFKVPNSFFFYFLNIVEQISCHTRAWDAKSNTREWSNLINIHSIRNVFTSFTKITKLSNEINSMVRTVMLILSLKQSYMWKSLETVQPMSSGTHQLSTFVKDSLSSCTQTLHKLWGRLNTRGILVAMLHWIYTSMLLLPMTCGTKKGLYKWWSKEINSLGRKAFL